MKNKKIIITALFAAVLLNAALVSLASATEDTPNLIAPTPDDSNRPEYLTPSPDDNSTSTLNDIYTTQVDNSTDTGTAPENAEPNLIAAPTDSSGNVLVIVAVSAGVVLLVSAVGIGVVFYRKKRQI